MNTDRERRQWPEPRPPLDRQVDRLTRGLRWPPSNAAEHRTAGHLRKHTHVVGGGRAFPNWNSCVGQPTVGSNPTLSAARPRSRRVRGALVGGVRHGLTAKLTAN